MVGWLVNGWSMVGRWSVDGWLMVGQWPVDDWSKSYFGPKVILVQKLFWSKSCFGPKVILVQKSFWSKSPPREGPAMPYDKTREWV